MNRYSSSLSVEEKLKVEELFFCNFVVSENEI